MQRRFSKPALEVGVRIKAAAWRRALPRASRLAESAALAAFAAARPKRLSRAGAEAAVVLADDAQMRALNRDYRGRDKPTNVLAFAARDWRETPRAAAAQPLALGDVVVALETARAEAAAQRKPLADHLRHLVVHGMLHLLGHDHRGAREARRMERLEAKVLGLLDVPDPYAPLRRRRPPKPKTGGARRSCLLPAYRRDRARRRRGA
jgi:probable rRNA maturation factor